MSTFLDGDISPGGLLQAQQALLAVIDSLSDPVVMYGATGEVRPVNRAAAALRGRAMESRATDPVDEIDSAVRPILERMRSRVLNGKGNYTPPDLAAAIRVSSGEGDRYFLPRAAPVYEPPGRLVGATVILQEVTELRRLDELQNDMVATVAHELRTPLTSLRMAFQLCLEQVLGPLTLKQAEALHTARDACERLQAIVDDLLNFARVGAGCVAMLPQPISIASLVQVAIEAHRSAPVENMADVPDALRARRQARWQQLCEPVVVFWEGQPGGCTVRLPERGGRDGTISCHLRLENGEKRQWSLELDRAPIVEHAEVEGVRYIGLTATPPGPLPVGYHRLQLLWQEQSWESLVLVAPRRAYTPLRNTWGAFVPLYALHSQSGWGGGDMADLEALVEWTAERGGHVVATLPLLAAFLVVLCMDAPGCQLTSPR